MSLSRASGHSQRLNRPHQRSRKNLRRKTVLYFGNQGPVPRIVSSEYRLLKSTPLVSSIFSPRRQIAKLKSPNKGPIHNIFRGSPQRFGQPYNGSCSQVINPSNKKIAHPTANAPLITISTSNAKQMAVQTLSTTIFSTMTDSDLSNSIAIQNAFRLAVQFC